MNGWNMVHVARYSIILLGSLSLKFTIFYQGTTICGMNYIYCVCPAWSYSARPCKHLKKVKNTNKLSGLAIGCAIIFQRSRCRQTFGVGGVKVTHGRGQPCTLKLRGRLLRTVHADRFSKLLFLQKQKRSGFSLGMRWSLPARLGSQAAKSVLHQLEV